MIWNNIRTQLLTDSRKSCWNNVEDMFVSQLHRYSVALLRGHGSHMRPLVPGHLWSGEYLHLQLQVVVELEGERERGRERERERGRESSSYKLSFFTVKLSFLQ